MVRIKPFRGLRPRPGLEAKIASKPYDVLNSEEARKEADGNPYSFLHVVKSEIDLPGDISLYDPRVYEKAAENLQDFIQKKWLIRDEKPVLYLYGQKMGNHSQYGLVATAHVEDYLEGKIKIHELTREVKEKDRIRHVETTNANTGPVFLTYQASESIDEILEKVRQNKPVYLFTASDGVVHSLWVIEDEETFMPWRKPLQIFHVPMWQTGTTGPNPLPWWGNVAGKQIQSILVKKNTIGFLPSFFPITT